MYQVVFVGLVEQKEGMEFRAFVLSILRSWMGGHSPTCVSAFEDVHGITWWGVNFISGTYSSEGIPCPF